MGFMRLRYLLNRTLCVRMSAALLGLALTGIVAGVERLVLRSRGGV